MEIMDLIAKADQLDHVVRNSVLSEAVEKELRKIEMYCRKTYLMLKHVEILMDTTNDVDGNEFLTDLNTALIRDQKYIKARDSLGDYKIG